MITFIQYLKLLKHSNSDVINYRASKYLIIYYVSEELFNEKLN